MTKNLWGEAWLPYSANKSFLRVQRQDDTYPAHPTRARVPARGNTAAHCLVVAEDGFFRVITFTLKPGELLFGVQLPPRLPKGASEAERRAHAKREQTAYGQVNAAAIQAKRQLYRSAGTKPWQESRRRA